MGNFMNTALVGGDSANSLADDPSNLVLNVRKYR